MKKKLSIIVSSSLLLAALNLNADFLGTLQNATTTSSFNTSNLGNVSNYTNISSLGGLMSGAQDSALSYGTDYILTNEALGQWWSKNTSFATGTLELCYQYNPISTGALNGDICSLLNNSNADACSTLPDQVGPYRKLSSNERMKKQIALRDWCSKMSGTNDKVPLTTASNMTGISGKTKKDVVDTQFNSTEKTKDEKKVSKSLGQFKDTTKAENNSYGGKVISLEKQGKGNVVKNEIKRYSKNSDDLTEASLNKLNEEVVFSSQKEYQDDLNSKALEDYEITKQLFDTNNHVKSAQTQFNSLNLQKKTYSDKVAYVDKYIDDKSTGVRARYYDWATEKAEEEIMYTVPSKVDNYYAVFNEKVLLSNTDYSGLDKKTQVAMINDDITKQQYYEKEVMLKWKRIADEKADELKNLLIKNAIASEQFNREVALQRINQLIGN